MIKNRFFSVHPTRSFKWLKKMLTGSRNWWRNIWVKVAEISFAEMHQIHPSYVARRKISDTELEKRARPYRHNLAVVEILRRFHICVPLLPFPPNPTLFDRFRQWTWESERRITSRGGRVTLECSTHVPPRVQLCAANARARSLTQQVVRGRWWKGNGGR